MKKILLSTALAISPVWALAADYPNKAVPIQPISAYSWTGLYLSGYGLYAANLTNTLISDGAGTPLIDLASAPHGPGIGGAFGYSYQIGSGAVLGVRADLAYANLQGSGQALNTVSIRDATNYLGDINGFIGIPLTPDGRLLGYLGGGFAFGGAKPNLQVASLQAAASDTSTGFDAMAGFAYALDRNWSVFMEGDYFQLGDKSLTTMLGGVPVATSLTKYHIFAQKLGVGFRF